MNAADVVVGFDGSASSRRAVRWAAAEAARQHTPLWVVLAYHPRWPGANLAVGGELDRAAHELAESVLDDAVADAMAFAPGIEVTGDAVFGTAALSRSAQLVVVGTRGHGGFAGLLLGSVGLHLLHHADCPVLVVREPTEAGTA